MEQLQHEVNRTEKRERNWLMIRSGKATTLFVRLKGTSIIFNVGIYTYTAFLSHTDMLISPHTASRMSQQMLSAAFQTTRKTSYYTPVCLLMIPSRSLPVSVRFTIQHQNTNAVRLYCMNRIYGSVMQFMVEGIRLLFWNRVILICFVSIWDTGCETRVTLLSSLYNGANAA